jgi:hypothetical protein
MKVEDVKDWYYEVGGPRCGHSIPDGRRGMKRICERVLEHRGEHIHNTVVCNAPFKLSPVVPDDTTEIEIEGIEL